MAAHDESWDVFRAELKRWMELRRVTNKELAHALNGSLLEAGLNAPIDERIVKRWRHSTAPPLQAIKVIARILHMNDSAAADAPHDPTYLPRVMGILDAAPAKGELIEAAYRLQSLHTQIADAQGTLAAATADESVMNIVRAAVHVNLGCSVLPIHEGPTGYPMHVCDRIDIRVSTPQTQLDFSEHHQLRDALADAFATPNPQYPGFCEQHGESHSRWAVPYIGRPRTRDLHTPHHKLPAIAITAVGTFSWIDVAGDILAMVLGYGFTTTRELAREIVSTPSEHDDLRNKIHDNFLHEATPTRRVWTHVTQAVPKEDPNAPFRDEQGRVTPDLVQFFVAEDDDVLRSGVMEDADAQTPEDELESRVEELTRTRDDLLAKADKAAEEHPLVVLPVQYSDVPEARWTQVFDCVLRVLRTLADLGIEASLQDTHDRLVRSEPGVAPQVLRWLADQEAPFVSSSFGTRP